MFDSDFVEESLEFIEESETLLLSLEGNLDSLKDSTQRSLTLAPFMRCLHSLKGASSMYGLVELVDFTHHLEQQVIKEIPVLTNEHIAFYLLELDKLKNAFEYQDQSYLSKQTKVQSIAVAPEPEPKSEVVVPAKPELKPVETKVETDEKPRIAFIDDEELIHEIFKHECRDQNWEIDSYTDSTNVANFQRYDLFIIDYMMPEMNGVELIEKIRQHYHKTPIILLSGFVTKDLCLKAFEFEHVIVIEKSPTFDLLILSAKQQIEKFLAYKLLSKSLDLIKYHYGDLHVFLKTQGLERLSDSIRTDIKTLERERKKLKI